jgi:nitrate reductase (cytochrome), electron transfer subunit
VSTTGTGPRWLDDRRLHLFGAIAVAVALIGFVTGTSKVPERRAAVTSTATAPPPGAVPRYEALPGTDRGANAGMYADAVATLRAGIPEIGGPALRDEAGRDRALADRAARRAYEGAPPTIPHEVEQLAVGACLTCHERGASIVGRIAPAISHERYQSCLQCHVVERDPRGFGEAPPPANAFVGLSAPGPGDRAWPGAPPTIPHPTTMRSECGSCHGPAGAAPLRTTHPERYSCEQCHAPSATLDQRAAWLGLEEPAR